MRTSGAQLGVGTPLTGYDRIPTEMGMAAAGAVYVLVRATLAENSLTRRAVGQVMVHQGVIGSVMLKTLTHCT